ncbi:MULTISPECIES: 16S rRNA (adenine(1518)-N(6)/adenine(1519)-N(6))-dimethyltransferase RsmA [Nitrospirillum]|uniref:Ribosomal RNA small subunit methyltransferase A n=1 Tax=Nitrospirillum amazonense TaxID=28077 RepID=A0A560EXK5_9PROT|nr:16S rRNA (adenine(1518)-N(6)/adenine(1519)-N(6))-dimethyltransferase RsmA [Nitrospirillum amazonense]MEC4594632.1 16S rRNA (adenine(1518)-N(6)/adenine(1519)-N(6))-dimethyltransferase RsmA [Nitrospirillum amazonense]TWB14097.1 dimethyladenosine transferase [Nitrospirillum amazonense]
MTSLAHLPPLRDVIARFDLGARKALGQHFLLDLNLTARVAAAAGDLAGVTVIEVGPGPGGLTRALVESDAKAVVAVERDSRFVAALADVVAAAAGRLTIVEGDALEVDMTAIAPAPRAIVANLPYNVGTPMLVGWLRQIQEFRSLTLMFQKEVVDRIVAKPRTKDYGRLAVMSQWLADARLVFDIPPQAFSPPPKVMSAVVHITPRILPADAPSFKDMERVVAAAFNQRRKMLRAGLKGLVAQPEPLLEAAGILPTSRAEEVDVAGFVRLAHAWRAHQDTQF